MSELCQNTYLPNREITVDETLLLFKCRLQIRQYIPSKRKRYGLKSYALCESESGYVWKLQLHSLGNHDFGTATSPGIDRRSVSERIVVMLTCDLLGQGYHLYNDNLYTSYRLAKYLLQNNTLMTGTVKQNRGVQDNLKAKTVAAKDQAYARCDDVLCQNRG